MVPASSIKFFDIQANYRVWIYSETRTWHDNNIQSQIHEATMQTAFSWFLWKQTSNHVEKSKFVDESWYSQKVIQVVIIL